jgi:hypothetical protein
MVSLETLALANNPQDAGPSSPPKRYRKFTISYANAVNSGILKNTNTADQSAKGNNTAAGNATTDTNTQDTGALTSNHQINQEKNSNYTSNSTGSSLSRSLTNSKIPSTPSNLDSELKALKNNLERRMDKQEEQMSEIVQVIKTMNEDFEKRMIHVVLAALSKEKEKVQEITHGRVYHASEAPLADESGNLPYGVKVQLGGPLDRLHHVEVTVQQMAAALDTILEHIQKDPTAKYLFDEDSSETPTIIETPLPITQQNQAISVDTPNTPDNDVQMTAKEQSGTKRQHAAESPPRNCHGPDPNIQSSPNRSPPPKKRTETNQPPSANPDDADRERGQP